MGSFFHKKGSKVHNNTYYKPLMKSFEKFPLKDCLKKLGDAEFPTNPSEPEVFDLASAYERFTMKNADASAISDRSEKVKKFAVSDENRSWPHQFDDTILQELEGELPESVKDILVSLKNKGPLDEWPQSEENPQLINLRDAIRSFIAKQDSLLIQDLLDAKSLELVIQELGQKLRQYLLTILDIPWWRSKLPKLDDFEHLWLAAMDMMCIGFKLAFHNRSMSQMPSLGGFMPRHVSPVRDAIQAKPIEASKIIEEQIDARLESEHIARMIKYASKTESQEKIKTLAPAQKARIFMNALRARNDYGEQFFVEYIVSETGRMVDKRVEYVPMIIFKMVDQQIVQKFFEVYRNLNVDEVLQVLDQCVRYYCKTSAKGRPPSKEMFNAYNGRNTRWLLKHFVEIVESFRVSMGINFAARHALGLAATNLDARPALPGV